MNLTHCIFMRGQGGWLTSYGVGTLGQKAEQLGRGPCTVLDWNEQQAAYDSVLAFARQVGDGSRLVLYGYSLGANAVTFVAEALAKKGIAVDLLVAMDPTIWSAIRPLTKNVRQAVCYRNLNFLNVVGLAGLAAQDPSILTTYKIADFHLFADINGTYQKQILDRIAAVSS